MIDLISMMKVVLRTRRPILSFVRRTTFISERNSFPRISLARKNRDALGGIRTRTGSPPEDFTYHYRFRGLPCEALRLCKTVRGLDCLFAVPFVTKTVRFDKIAFVKKRVRRLLYSLYTLSATCFLWRVGSGLSYSAHRRG